MPAYMSIDASKHEGTARKVTLADFGIEGTKRDTRTVAPIAAYAKRKSEAHKKYDEQQKAKGGK